MAPPPIFTRTPNARAHPYPYSIGLRAQTYLTGSTFYFVFVDEAVSQFVRQVPDAYDRVKASFGNRDVSELDWNVNWRAFEEYMRNFPSPVFQNTLFVMSIHWDRYIGYLGRFVSFGRNHIGFPPLTKKQERQLLALSRVPIQDQLTILQVALGTGLHLPSETLEGLREMNLVRNLGMHNEWEVDQHYLKLSQQTEFRLGHTREVTAPELFRWRDFLNSAITETCRVSADVFHAAPDFNPAAGVTSDPDIGVA